MLPATPTNCINALGFLEVRGLAVAIEVADAMLKCADVRLLRQLRRDPAQITLVVEGSLGACSAAVDAGKNCAAQYDALISAHVMGRPDAGTGSLILDLIECDFKPKSNVLPSPEVLPSESQPPALGTTAVAIQASESEQLLQAIASLSGACGSQILAARLGRDQKMVQAKLDTLCAEGKLLKKRGRYLIPQSREDKE